MRALRNTKEKKKNSLIAKSLRCFLGDFLTLLLKVNNAHSYEKCYNLHHRNKNKHEQSEVFVFGR